MLTASKFLTSAMPGPFIDFDLQTTQELIEAAEQIDNGHYLENAFLIQSELPHRGSMDSDSVFTPHHGRDGNCDDFLGQAIELI